jgi:hypothetical protein
MVEADLPEHCALSLDMTGVELLRVLGSMPPEVEGQRRASPQQMTAHKKIVADKSGYRVQMI